MKAYTVQIGEMVGEKLTKIVFSEKVFADSLGEAIDKARAATRERPAHDDDNGSTVVILDEEQADEPMIWVRSVAEVRAG